MENQGKITKNNPDSGLEDADLEKVFDAFYTTTEAGTGLGLSISHQSSADNHGSITVERNLERGMTFTLNLPVRQNPPQETQS
jgi:two-component system C4-dicarboxylate transport sensor histidine kinase DctB